MSRVQPARLLHPGSGPVRALGAACGLAVLLAWGAGARTLVGQERSVAPVPSLRPPASVPLQETGLVHGVLSPEASALFRAAPGDGPAGVRSRGADVPERPTPAPLFREVSALERGWRLVAGREAAPAGDGALGWPSEGSRGGDGDGEPPFLVELFDARDVMAWVREVRAWGMDARRVLFGPQGLVRAGSVPGSDRPRFRVELTDSRPGVRVVILTR